jgi:hypothetical protein
MAIFSRREGVWREWKNGNEYKILVGEHGG